MVPEEELKRLTRLIRQFESVFRTTSDPVQRERVSRELKRLKTEKEQIESFHEIDPKALGEEAQADEFQGLEFLKHILETVQKPAKEAAGELRRTGSRCIWPGTCSFSNMSFCPC